MVIKVDCCAIGPGFKSREGMYVCKCIMPLWHESTLNSRQDASPLVRLIEEKRGGIPLTTPRLFSLKIAAEPSQIKLSPKWYSKLRPTTQTHNINFTSTDFVDLNLMPVSIGWYK
ncbi:hypothetical protein TNCV_870501 [Trichonephila clavipes]|nr:hypothetical protein TNCV_870501 [Trichonephila clavipes]